MREPSGSSADLKPFEAPKAGQVLRLREDWEALIRLFPKLRSAATVFRAKHAIFSRHGRFEEASLAEGFAFRTRSNAGLSLRLESWHEAWWYEEERRGEMVPCLEVADEFGRGILKLCYRSRKEALGDMPLIRPLIAEAASEWDLLHLRRCNTTDCCETIHLGRKPAFHEPIHRIFREAHAKRIEMGFLLPQESQSVWDTLPAVSPGRVCCWLTAGGGNRFLSIETAGFGDVELHDRGCRRVASFDDRHGQPSLILIEPEGANLDSITALHDPAI
ncbi:MAG: ChuX/HutX family heme-like substrate-binding protein [Verrucomicrobiota bacterium]